MFNSLRGILSAKKNDSVHLVIGGIEWEIFVPAIDMARLPLVGKEARLLIWLYHREDQMRLYGFIDERRRDTFLELQKVEGIGPRQASKIMGGIGQDDLEKALDAGDLGRLEAVPGLGKKTAQKMLLALKGRLVHEEEAPVLSTLHAELVRALVDMGYDKKAALDAVAKADTELESGSGKGTQGAEREKTLFKRAIMLLSGA
ncbi:Holliday junction branch migration protein RuvA [Treponema sp.]